MKKETSKKIISNNSKKSSSSRIKTVFHFLLFLCLVSTLTSVMTLYLEDLPQNLEVGEIANKDFKANQDYEIVDEKSTEQLKKDALESIRPVYDYDLTVKQGLINKVSKSFQKAREYLIDIRSKQLDVNQDKPLNELTDEQNTELKKLFLDHLELTVTNQEYQFLKEAAFSSIWENIFIHLLNVVYNRPVIHDRKELKPLVEKGITIRKLTGEDAKEEETINSLDGIIDIEMALSTIGSFPASEIKDLFTENEINSVGFKYLKSLAQKSIKNNLNFNGIETDYRKQKAVGNIKNTIIKVKRGESIIRRGDRFEPWHLTVIQGIKKNEQKVNRTYRYIGLFCFVAIILLIPYYYASKYIKEFKPTKKDAVFLGSALIFFLVILRVGVFLATSLKETFPIELGEFTLYYLIPLAGGTMLVRFMLNSEIALLFAVVISFLTGIFLQNNLELTLYYFISSVFSAHAITRVDKRSTVFLYGALVGIVNAGTIAILNMLGELSVSGLDTQMLITNCIAGFLGGIFTAMLLLILSPMVEAIFGYTTDIKLLELATLSHPLLKEMIVKSPGTYHHSQLVGVLAEAGAQAIGANALLARVASYYHDIGKMKKSQYFIENQRGENPHDKLSPSMSALIIAAHVKDGIDMAKKYKLPQKIADMIPQHQGTKLIGYFYSKAKKSMDPAHGTVDEADYRYPGPKPQTKEAGVIMLADAIEAAVRSIPDKTPLKIKTMVEKLINSHFVDEQLDECDLTLKDLHLIAGAFIDILNGIYHSRVEYPKDAVLGKNSNISIKKEAESNDGTPKQSGSSESNIRPLFKEKNS